MDVSRVGIFMKGNTERLEEDGGFVYNPKFGNSFLYGECSYSNHSKTSVVDLREKTLFLLLSGHVLTGRKRGTNILSFQKSVSKDDSVKTSPC